MRPRLWGALGTGALLLAMALPAAAVPRADSVSLHCGEAGTFEGVLFSYGNPIRIVGTNRNFVVLSAYFIDDNGDRVDVQRHPDTRQALIECTFEVSGRSFTATGFFSGT